MRDELAGPSYIETAHSLETDESRAAEEIAARLDASTICFALIFVPARLDASRVADALNRCMEGIPVFGCTSAGQLTGAGYDSDTLLALGFPRAYFRCASVLLEPLTPLSIPSIAKSAMRCVSQFKHTSGWNRLALLFADGLSKQEDILASTLETALNGLPVFGGSAGDGLDFEKTFVLHGGKAHSNAALLLLLETTLTFRGLSIDHFMPTDQQVVITSADPEERVVFEINGAPAAEEYARLVGCTVEELSPTIFAENPLLVRHNVRHYVRAIGGASDDRALSFLAAIDDGLIMTLGRGKEIVQTFDTGLSITDEKDREPDFVLGFDCVLRRLEIEQKQLSGEISEVLLKRRVLGFNTYGEQHHGVHMNQTFVGVAFFSPQARNLP